MNTTMTAADAAAAAAELTATARFLRGLLAVSLVVALAIIALHAHSEESSAYTFGDATTQQIRIYLAAVFEAITAIGVALGAYIAIRLLD